MRLRVVPLALLAAVPLALPHLAHAAIPFFGPIIPPEVSACPLGWGSVINVINRLIELLLTIAIVGVAPIMIAYSGFLFVVNPVNPSGKEKAKKILLNTIIGIVIALAGWLIVDAVLVALTNQGVSGWTALIGSQGFPACLPQAAAVTPPAVPPISAPSPRPVGQFAFAPGIAVQASAESIALAGLLSCMGAKLPTNATISSISDSAITSGQATFQRCATNGGCAHTINSCHYGGSGRCNGQSYAVDLVGDLTALTAVAQACRASTLNEGNHLHASVGAQNGCGCDVNLTNSTD